MPACARRADGERSAHVLHARVAAVRDRASTLVDRIGAKICDVVGKRGVRLLRRGRASRFPALLLGGHLHNHGAAGVVVDDSLACRTGLAVDRGSDIAPRAAEAFDDFALGAALSTHHVTEMYCVSMNSISPSCAPSLPMPDCFVPPNGAAGSETSPRLSPIMPKSSCSDTRMPRLMSLV